MPHDRTPGFYNPRLFFALVLATSSLACLVVAESKKPEAPAAAASDTTGPRFDCCALLTAQEIEAVQKSPIKDKKNSERAHGGLLMNQCIYVAADFPESVSLAISRTDPADPSKRNVSAYWKETFGRFSEPIEAGEPEKRSPGSAKEEKESVPPKKVEGVGDDAYWLADRVGGALYVLKKDAILRLSLGGKQTEETRLEKSKALAQKALARL